MARKELSPYAPDVWIRHLNRKYPSLWTEVRIFYNFVGEVAEMAA